ncbi:MAG: hypothetical protein VYD00_00795 [Pseudomonadota bacterium]|nr:hypothetical protein [Pseudomonadota bacterium]
MTFIDEANRILMLADAERFETLRWESDEGARLREAKILIEDIFDKVQGFQVMDMSEFSDEYLEDLQFAIIPWGNMSQGFYLNARARSESLIIWADAMPNSVITGLTKRHFNLANAELDADQMEAILCNVLASIELEAK